MDTADRGAWLRYKLENQRARRFYDFRNDQISVAEAACRGCGKVLPNRRTRRIHEGECPDVEPTK